MDSAICSNTDGAITPDRVGQRKTNARDITHTWKLKRIQMNRFTRQKLNYRQRKQIYVYERGKVRGGINQEAGINRHKTKDTRTHCIA